MSRTLSNVYAKVLFGRPSWTAAEVSDFASVLGFSVRWSSVAGAFMSPYGSPHSSSAHSDLQTLFGARELPVFPRHHQQILRELRSEASTPVRLVEAISMEPTVCVQVLRMANLAAYGFQRPVDNIHHAVLRLGRTRLEGMVIGLGTAQVLSRHRTGPLDHTRFWSLAVRRAALARRLAEQVCLRSSPTIFTAALLSDIAIPMLSSIRPRVYAELLHTTAYEAVRLESLELEVFGWTHETVGGWLAQIWQLPATLGDLIASHHSTLTGKSRSADVVRAAAMVTGSLGRESAKHATRQAASVCWHHLGLLPEHTQALVRASSTPDPAMVDMFARPAK